MIGKTFDELSVGQSARFSKTITETDIYLYAGISGDFNPAHVNEAYAATTFFISLQTRESSEWENEFRRRATTLNSDVVGMNAKRGQLLNGECTKALNRIRLVHGASKTSRALKIHLGSDAPVVDGTEVPVWIRDGWGDSESAVTADARKAGADDATVYVHIPKASAEDLKKAIIEFE
ncbi:MAG: MaoC/PaaZ C-terminal domain-containing protein, partial [Desulfobacterales bacterium]